MGWGTSLAHCHITTKSISYCNFIEKKVNKQLTRYLPLYWLSCHKKSDAANYEVFVRPLSSSTLLVGKRARRRLFCQSVSSSYFTVLYLISTGMTRKMLRSIFFKLFHYSSKIKKQNVDFSLHSKINQCDFS